MTRAKEPFPWPNGPPEEISCCVVVCPTCSTSGTESDVGCFKCEGKGFVVWTGTVETERQLITAFQLLGLKPSSEPTSCRVIICPVCAGTGESCAHHPRCYECGGIGELVYSTYSNYPEVEIRHFYS